MWERGGGGVIVKKINTIQLKVSGAQINTSKIQIQYFKCSALSFSIKFNNLIN